MKFLPGNAQNIGARNEQQDAFAFSNPADKEFLSHAGLLALVSDGMGGLSHGQQASSSAVRAFLTSYEQKSREETIPAALYRSFQAAFGVVEDLNRSAAGQGGATLVAAVAHVDQLYWISAGDSHLYLIRKGRLVQLNRDHTYGERLLDQVMIDRVSLGDAISHPEREHLTSYLGMAGTPEVDCNIRPFQLELDDQVVLCTDGVYRGLVEEDFVRAFAGATPSESCGRLEAIVLSRVSQQQDNLTVVAFRCADEGPAKGGWRPKVAAGAAGLLFCANLAAADIAWKTVREKLDALNAKGAPKSKDSVGTPPSEPRAGSKRHEPREGGATVDAEDGGATATLPHTDKDGYAAPAEEAAGKHKATQDTNKPDPNKKVTRKATLQHPLARHK
jgi:protein phosphatase